MVLTLSRIQRLASLPPKVAGRRAAAATAPAASIRSMAVFPEKINLETSRDFHAFTVIATSTDDVTADVTGKATVALEDPALASIRGHRLTPLMDGSTTLTVSFEGRTVQVPVNVRGATEDRPLSFTLDVMPVFMRNACNTGACHGAARGQDGFQFSLFGFDPKGDHYRLTQEPSGRRVNLGLAEDSLVLTKLSWPALGPLPWAARSL